MLGCDFEPGMWVRHKRCGFMATVTRVCCNRGRNWPFENTYAITIKQGVTESTWPPHELEIVPDEPTIEELQALKLRIGELERACEEKDEVIQQLNTEINDTPKYTHIALYADGVEVFEKFVKRKS